jgi:hypothetical protein
MNDQELRSAIYEVTMREGAPPKAARLSDMMQAPVAEALHRLAAAHMLVLQPDGVEILMAGPFSAVPTPFRVTLDAFCCYGNCIWDALGIAATMHANARIDTSCGDCGAAVRIDLRDSNVIGDGLVHFALPPRLWWEDIVFT